MNDLYAIWIVMLLTLCAVLLIILLVRQSRGLREQHRSEEENEHAFAQLSGHLLDELDEQRDETAEQLHTANQSLMTTLSQMGQAQSALLESMQRQVLLSTRNQEERAGQTASVLNDGLTRIDTRLENFRLENERQLTQMRRTVDEKLTESLDKKLTASFSQVSERLESVYKGLGEMHALASGVGDLKRVLTNVKTRGIWGEMLLGSLIRQSLSPGQYDENTAVIPNGTERVEFAIRLPDKAGGIIRLPVDSKFPQEDYLRLTEASQRGDAAGTENARKELCKRIRTEAKRIASKYIVPPYTTDFAVMFLPIEGLYAEVLQDPELPESIQREYRVVIAGPGTFSAMLNALQMGFRTMAIEQRSGEVWRLLGDIKTDFGRFADLLQDTRRRLDQAGESIDSAFTKTKTIQRRLADVEEPVFELPPEGASSVREETTV